MRDAHPEGLAVPAPAAGPARRSRGRPARAAAVAVAAFACATLLGLAVPGQARAQVTDSTLVSTLGQTVHSSATATVGFVSTNNRAQAQRFTTGGSSAHSYALSKVARHRLGFLPPLATGAAGVAGDAGEDPAAGRQSHKETRSEGSQGSAPARPLGGYRLGHARAGP